MRTVNGKLLLNAHEAAQLLGISERHLWQLTSRGHVPCLRLGRRTLFPLDLLKQWIIDRAQADQQFLRDSYEWKNAKQG
jgi:excisionase family DNA binding protein